MNMKTEKSMENDGIECFKMLGFVEICMEYDLESGDEQSIEAYNQTVIKIQELAQEYGLYDEQEDMNNAWYDMNVLWPKMEKFFKDILGGDEVMKRNKILEQINLVEIVSDTKEKNHFAYFLDGNGKVITFERFMNKDKTEVIKSIPHIFKIAFTQKQFWEMKCATMFNQIFEPDVLQYNQPQLWDMNRELVQIIQHLSKIKNVENYYGSEEAIKNGLIVDEFISARPTEIEKKDEDVHRRGIIARAKMIEFMNEWVL